MSIPKDLIFGDGIVNALRVKENDDHDYMADISETGPWNVSVHTKDIVGEKTKHVVYLMSDDFTHDAALEITGDFANIEQRIEYANRLAERMNRMPK
jgi:hypothetical protein